MPVTQTNLQKPAEPKIEDQKFKRVAIVEDSDSEEEEPAAPAKAPEPEPVKESKPLITEIGEKKAEKKTSNFLTEKDSNYGQFDMNKVQPKKVVESAKKPNENDPLSAIK